MKIPFFKFKEPKNKYLFIIMMLTILIMLVMLPDIFLSQVNIRSMASQFPEFGFLALAMMLAMITGGIDLSVVATANFTGVIAALILTKGPEAGMSPILAIVLAIASVIALAIPCGLINGILIAFVGVPPILATLGTQGLFLGLATVITKGLSIANFPNQFLFIGSGYLFGVPFVFILFLIGTIVVALILGRTQQGFSMYMIGSNPTVARYSGVNNSKIIIKTYVITAILAAVSSIIMISRANSMRPGYGSSYLLQAILVVVLGGADPDGGFGNIPGLLMAIVMLQVTQSGLNILAFSPFVRKFIWGFALLLVMTINFTAQQYGDYKRVKKMRQIATTTT
ncbi:MAG: ABC transporter permease [Sphaerochaetaceae bacterium]